ncbi:DMT family transporter [Pseudonocardia spinosispora]|uniref:DMT family transporter n=1 Tax=Pseudonocardia spinosispora TaxID=103441 RepID=UPI00040441DC|nr:DMT family transporter [Pseudonocardia spinosispora]
MTVTVIVSLFAAACFGLASALQHLSAWRVRRRSPVGLLVELAGKRTWLAGIAAQATGVALHLVAVNLGPLSIVQPVLTVGLVVALGLQRLAGRPISPRSMRGAAVVVLGLAVFLAVAPDSPPDPPAGVEQWVPGLLLAGIVLTVTLIGGLIRSGVTRCLCFGAAAGVLMATSAALAKAWGAILLLDGLTGLVGSWQLWTAVACGACGTLLSQAAFQAGPLGGSLAVMMAIDPVIGVCLGVVVFGEPFATGDSMVVRLLGLGLTLVGVGLLATSARTTSSGRQLSNV